MAENIVQRLNELKEDFFKSMVEEKLSTKQNSSIFLKKTGTSKGYTSTTVLNLVKDNINNEDDSENLQNQIDTLKQKKTDNESKISNQNSKIDNTNSSINETKGNISAKQGELNALKEPQESDYKKEDGTINYTAYNRAKNAYLARKAQLEREIQMLQNKLDRLENELSSEKEELSALEEEGNRIDSELSSLEAEQRQLEMQASKNNKTEEQQEEKSEEEIEEEQQEEEKAEKERERKQNEIINTVNQIIQEYAVEAKDAGIRFNANIFSSNNFDGNIDKAMSDAKKAEEIKVDEKAKKYLTEEIGFSKEQADNMFTTIDSKLEKRNDIKLENEDGVNGAARIILSGKISKYIESHGGNLPSAKEMDKLTNEAIEEAVAIQDKADILVESALEITEKTGDFSVVTDNIENIIKLAKRGRSASEIARICTTPALLNNIDKVMELIESGLSLDDISAMINSEVFAQEKANIIKLSEMGKNISEIIEIINNPNCRKAMAHVFKLVEMGKSTSEIIKMLNNSNSLMNLNQTVELASSGKNADEINDIYNDSNSIGNLETAIKLAKLNVNANNIIGMLNDSKVKKALTGSEIIGFAENIANSKNKKSDVTDKKIKEELNTEADNSKNTQEYGIFKSIVDNMEFNNVKEKDIYNILNGNSSLNQSNTSSNTSNNINILEMELLKKKNRA